MAHGKDYVPKKDADFDVWFKFMIQYVAKKCSIIPPATAAEWTHIPAEVRAALADAYAFWYTLYLAVIGPHTPVDTQAKNNAKKAAIAKIRPFVNQYLRFLPVTDEDRTAMGIPNRDTIPTPIEPTTRPEFALTLKDIRQIGIVFWDQGKSSKHRAIPYGMNGAVVLWEVRPDPPDKPENLSKSALATRTRFTLEFEEPERGKTVNCKKDKRIE
jgi:hypothetical protein